MSGEKMGDSILAKLTPTVPDIPIPVRPISSHFTPRYIVPVRASIGMEEIAGEMLWSTGLRRSQVDRRVCGNIKE